MEEKRPRGRPPGTGKPYRRPEELRVEILYARVPAALAEEFRRWVPAGKRSDFIRDAVERALKRLERELAKREGVE